MKILMVNKFLYPNGGSETYMLGLGKQLAEMGHQVEYFGMEHPRRVVGNHAESYTANLDFHTGKLKKVLYPLHILYSREAGKKIKRVLADFQPDAVHLNNFNFQLTPSILYAIRAFGRQRKRKIKIVYTAHDSQLVCPNHLMRQFLTGEGCTRCVGGSPWNCTRYKCIHGSGLKSLLGSLEAAIYRSLKTYELIDWIICPSRFIKEKLDAGPVPGKKTRVLQNFIDNGNEEYPQPDTAVNNGKYVLYFGRYSEEKGIATLLEVVRRLPQIPFVFAGSGPLEGEVNKIAHIDNRGFLSGEALKEAIAGAAFSIFPSECYENCPYAVMESLQAGVPVIAAGTGGTPELINAGVTGALFDSGNAEGLYQEIITLWAQEERLKSYREACRGISFLSAAEYCERLLTDFYI